MENMFGTCMGNNYISLSFLVLSLVILQGCIGSSEITHDSSEKVLGTNIYDEKQPHECINIDGTIFQEIDDNAPVYLYKIENLNYSLILEILQRDFPIQKVHLNETKGFQFNCLYPGLYAIVAPKFRLNSSYEWILPYEYNWSGFPIEVAIDGEHDLFFIGIFGIGDQCPYNNYENQCSSLNPYL